MMNRVILTDEEWMSLIDGDREGLPRCCGTISDLRDYIIQLARDGGVLNAFYAEHILERERHVRTTHDLDSPVLDKLMDQIRRYQEEARHS